MLHRRHDRKLPIRRQDLQEQRIPDRSERAGLEIMDAVEVARRVVVDERWPVGEERDHSQRKTRGQEAREERMGPDKVPHPGADPGTGRAATRSTATSANTV